MAAKKQSKSKSQRHRPIAPAPARLPIVLSTAARSMLNMAVVVMTSGSVLVFLLTAKRFL
jgi:hypothetical protein